VWWGISQVPPRPAQRPTYFENGVGIWLDFDFLVPVLLVAGPSDAEGRAALPIDNPGGLWGAISVQAVATILPGGSGQLRSSHLLHLSIQP